MTLSHFEYYAPTSVEEAVALLEANGENAFIMAGGTDLLIKRRHQMIHPKVVVSLKKIQGMNRISYNRKKGLFIGATALLADITKQRSIKKFYPAIAKAAGNTANVQIRNMGTIVGNLCNASPAADNAPALLALNAVLTIQGPQGKRTVPLEDFFVGPGLTVLQPAEIVAAIIVPVPPPGSAAAYLHLSARGKIDCSAANAGVFLSLKNKKIETARLFIGACGPIPMRMRKAEKKLTGQKLTGNLAHQAGQLASRQSTPISDVRADKDYRLKMVTVLAKRAIIEAYQHALNA